MRDLIDSVLVLLADLAGLHGTEEDPVTAVLASARYVCSTSASSLPAEDVGLVWSGLAEQVVSEELNAHPLTAAWLGGAAATLGLLESYRTVIADLPYTESVPSDSKPAARAVLYCAAPTARTAAHMLAPLEEEAQRRGWHVTERLTDEMDGVKEAGRPALRSALRLLADDRADVLAATRPDQLAESVRDLAHIVEEAFQQGWELVLLDPPMETASPAGSLITGVMVAAAEWDRRLGSRTPARRDRAGRPVEMSRETVARILELRAGGASLRSIADALNAEGYRTPRGGPWRHSSVQYTLQRREDDDQ